LKIRKSALAAATLALAITPALTAVTPAQAAPARSAVLGAAAAEELSLVEQILSVFPPTMAEIARQILAGDFTRLFELFTEATKLTPTQINEIFAKLQEILNQFVPAEPAPTTADAPETAPASYTGGPVFVQVGAPSTADQKTAWVLEALLKDAGKKRTAPLLANILFSVAIAGQ
jgi:hypothetical protein